MNKNQYLIILRFKKQIREAKRKERVLEKMNQDPINQHAWDEWNRASGIVDGLESGFYFLKSFLSFSEK